MRRILSLYPKRWRDRYGDEMDQLLDDAPLTLRGAASIGSHALRLRMGDRRTLATLSALLALLAIMPLLVMAFLALNFVVLQNPIDGAIVMALIGRLPMSAVMTVLAVVLAGAPMLEYRQAHPHAPRALRIRWREYPVHAAIALVASGGTLLMLEDLYDMVWHAVAQWYWATCETSCGELWMVPISLAGTAYPWILLVPAGWLAWRRRVRATAR